MFISFISWYIDELMSNRSEETKASNKELKDLKQKLNKWCENSKITLPLQLKTVKTKARDKRINCKTFHDAGIYVAVDSHGFGYREVPETYGMYRIKCQLVTHFIKFLFISRFTEKNVYKFLFKR